MQFVGQTGRSLKTRFREHFRKMKKPKKFDTFLYRHFKNNGHSPSKMGDYRITELSVQSLRLFSLSGRRRYY